MSLSGYFNFYILTFLRQEVLRTHVDDRRFARSNIVLSSDRLYRLSLNMALVVQKEPFICFLSVDTGFGAAVDFDDFQ